MNPLGDCAFCGRPSIHAHHITGKDPWKRHLDPELVVNVCQQHHTLVHEDLRSQGLDRPRDRDGWNQETARTYRLTRLGVFVGRYATYHDEPFFALLAPALWTWAEPDQEEQR